MTNKYAIIEATEAPEKGQENAPVVKKRGRPAKSAASTAKKPGSTSAAPTPQAGNTSEVTAVEPGSPKKKATRPWFKTGPLNVPEEVKEYYKARGMDVRFCTADKMSERVYQGFKPAKLPDSLKPLAPDQPTMLDGAPHDSTWRIRNQTLCVIDADVMKEKREWLEEQSKANNDALANNRDGLTVREYKQE